VALYTKHPVITVPVTHDPLYNWIKPDPHPPVHEVVVALQIATAPVDKTVYPADAVVQVVDDAGTAQLVKVTHDPEIKVPVAQPTQAAPETVLPEA